ncbi:MAG TPA: hypothetical protein VFB80_07815 [Pirellulaceae bacterium]|nr:hypothetical protein [Pirellulaceae bacterium]
MITALVLWSGLALAQVAEAPPATADAAAQLKSKVAALVRQLDLDEAAKRDAAEKELIALGPEVAPLLPPISNRTPAEISIRLNRVRNALTKLEIEAATKPSQVTLSGEMPVSKAFAEITRQTGNKLIDYRERFGQEASDPTIKVELDKVPFWQALDTVLDAAKLTLYNFDEEQGGVAYTSRGSDAGPRTGRASYSGLFRLEPSRIEATRDLKNSTMHGVKLTADALWEPRVRPIVLEVPLAEVSAKDEAGKEIGIDQTEGTLEVPVEGTNAAVEIELPLTAPERSVKTVASIKGKITAVVLGKIETFEFADVDKIERAKAAELERGGVTVVLESCRKNGDIYDVSMRVRFDRAANALESHRSWIYNNECYMLDPKGTRIENAGLEANLLAVNEVGLSYKFDIGEDAKPAGYKFVYRTPAAIIKIPVDFELKGIDLP